MSCLLQRTRRGVTKNKEKSGAQMFEWLDSITDGGVSVASDVLLVRFSIPCVWREFYFARFLLITLALGMSEDSTCISDSSHILWSTIFDRFFWPTLFEPLNTLVNMQVWTLPAFVLWATHRQDIKILPDCMSPKSVTIKQKSFDSVLSDRLYLDREKWISGSHKIHTATYT